MSKMCVTYLRLIFHRLFVFRVMCLLQMYAIILNVQIYFFTLLYTRVRALLKTEMGKGKGGNCG